MKKGSRDSTMRGLKPQDLRTLLHPKKALKKILQAAIRETRADSGSFILINPNTGMLDIEASLGLSERAKNVKLKPGEGITGWVASSGSVVRVGDVREERRYVAVNARIRSELAVPVELDGQVIAVLNVDSKEAHAFTEADEARLVGLAAEAAEWLRHGWEIDQLRIKSQQLTTLADMSQMIVSEINLDEALVRITRDACRLMKTKLCSLMLVSEDGKELILRAYHGASDMYQKKPNLPVEESLVGYVVARRKPLAVLNVRENQRYLHTEIARQEGLVSLLAVPLIFGQDLLGVLCVYTEQLHRFSNEEIKLLTALADMSAVAIEKTRLLARVVDMEEKLRASERLSALGLLAAEIAHEIRNPLTVMQMLFHALMEGLPKNEGSQRDAEVISDKMRQMNRIVDQVLTFARSSEPIKEPVDPRQLLDDISLLVRHKLNQQKVDIRSAVKPGLPQLKADRAQLEQAILNLVLNACDAMPRGGTLRLSASLEIREEGSHVVLAVKDTGSGMSREQTEKLFAPFLTSKQHGTGIGLAIVRKIIENHQGKVEVESKVGKGTTFRLLLPVGD
jgi:signal transduction histidine kinase